MFSLQIAGEKNYGKRCFDPSLKYSTQFVQYILLTINAYLLECVSSCSQPSGVNCTSREKNTCIIIQCLMNGLFRRLLLLKGRKFTSLSVDTKTGPPLLKSSLKPSPIFSSFFFPSSPHLPVCFLWKSSL